MSNPVGIVGTSWPWKVFPKWITDMDVIKESMHDIIFTSIGERKMSLEYGSEVISTVFENKGVMLQALARRTISLAIAVNLPLVSVLNIDVEESEIDTDPVTISVDFIYLGQQGTMVATVDGQ